MLNADLGALPSGLQITLSDFASIHPLVSFNMEDKSNSALFLEEDRPAQDG